MIKHAEIQTKKYSQANSNRPTVCIRPKKYFNNNTPLQLPKKFKSFLIVFYRPSPIPNQNGSKTFCWGLT